MRIPLIVLIVIFAVSVFGLTLIPGRDENGQPFRMGFFDAFYFMSSTATTIGFGEIPNRFTDAQRLWVTATIYLTVIGWAYAIASLLALLQDRGFREAIALQRFIRRVARLREPFLLGRGIRAVRDEGMEVTVIEPSAVAAGDAEVVAGDGFEPSVMALAEVAHAVGFVAGTDSDNGALEGSFCRAVTKRPGFARRAAAVSDRFVVPTEPGFAGARPTACRAGGRRTSGASTRGAGCPTTSPR